MRIALIYPPDRTLPSMAYSSLSVLATAMRARGHEVMVVDLNLEVTDLLVRRETLAAFRDFVEREFAAFEAKPRIPEAERWRYETFAVLNAVPRESLERAEEGKAVMRDPERFFVPELFNRAFDDISAALRLIFAATPLLYPESPTYLRDCLNFLAASDGDPVMDAYRRVLRERVVRFAPHLVGFTLPFHQQFIEALKFAKALKEALPGVKCVIGGTSTVDYEKVYFADTRLEGVIDYGVLNDGECALDLLARHVGGEVPVEAVPNLIHFRDGAVVRNPLEPELQDLNAAPTPDFTGIPLSRYLMPHPVANLCTSRGCYYGKCAFCGDSFRRNFRMRRPELVFEDVKTIHERHGIRYFYFWDSLAPPRTLRHIAKEIAREGLDVRWFAETRLEKAYTNPELLDQLRRGGGRVLQFGFESGNQRVLDLMRKGNRMEVTDAILANLKRAGMQACTSWFIGFPTETLEEMLDTYRYIHAHRDVIALSVYSGTFMIGGDTDVVKHPDRYGVRVRPAPGGGYEWEHVDPDFPRWDAAPWNEAFFARSDIVLLNHGCFVLYHDVRPGTVLRITGFGRIGRLAFEIEDPAGFAPFVPPGNRVLECRFDPVPSRTGAAGDLLPGEGPFHLAYAARSGWVFPLDELSAEIFRRADGRTPLRGIARALGAPLEAVLERAGPMIDRGILGGWIDLPEGCHDGGE